MIQPARYTAYRAAGPIAVDGRLDEPSWELAPKAGPFVDIVTGEPAWFETRVAILWDDENLYFGFWAEETDVCSTLTERDSKIYEENDLEIFIAGRDSYYEFEINARNVVYEVLWFWKDVFRPSPEFDPASARVMVLDGVGGHVHERGERWGFLDWDFPGMRSGGPGGRGPEQPDQHRRRLDGRDRASVARHGADRRRPVATAERRRRVADRLFAIREDRAGRGSPGPVRRLDLEPARTLRLPHPRGLPLRDLLYFPTTRRVKLSGSGCGRPFLPSFASGAGPYSAARV